MEDAPAAQQASVEDAMQEDGAENGDGSVQEEEPDEDEVPKVRIVRYVRFFFIPLPLHLCLPGIDNSCLGGSACEFGRGGLWSGGG